MEIWKKYIIRGNLFFDQNKNEEAIEQYQLAVDRANKLFSHWFNPDEAVAAVLVSYHNLGDLYLRSEQTQLGLTCYQDAHQIMDNALKQEPEGTDRYTALLKGARCSYTNLITLTKKIDNPSESPRQTITDNNQTIEDRQP